METPRGNSIQQITTEIIPIEYAPVIEENPLEIALYEILAMLFDNGNFADFASAQITQNESRWEMFADFVDTHLLKIDDTRSSLEFLNEVRLRVKHYSDLYKQKYDDSLDLFEIVKEQKMRAILEMSNQDVDNLDNLLKQLKSIQELWNNFEETGFEILQTSN